MDEKMLPPIYCYSGNEELEWSDFFKTVTVRIEPAHTYLLRLTKE